MPQIDSKLCPCNVIKILLSDEKHIVKKQKSTLIDNNLSQRQTWAID